MLQSGSMWSDRGLLFISGLSPEGIQLTTETTGAERQQSAGLRLSGCEVTEEGCAALASALRSNPSHLRELDLSYNHPGDSAGRLLSAGQGDPTCKPMKLNVDHGAECRLVSGLRKLWITVQSAGCLGQCGLTEGCCSYLASVLRASNSQLKQLELRDNNLQDSGVTLLCAGLKEPNCELQTLGLSGCEVTEEGCAALASALRSNPSHLRELDLSYNHPGDSAGRLLSAGQGDPTCKPMKLK
ncbi:unnamed protein product [Coregonus sp. 'balchen']|nr:unnamed protein product [Coregonus sp. 'balchen']